MPCNCIDNNIHKVFFYWGLIVYRFKWVFLVVPIVISLGLSYGLTFKEAQTNNVPENFLTPVNSKWKIEKKVIEDLWPIKPGNFFAGKHQGYFTWNDVVAMAKDGGNALRYEYLNDLWRINRHIYDNLSITVTDKSGKQVNKTYDDLCLKWQGSCYDNGHILLLRNLDDLRNDPEIANDTLKLRYVNENLALSINLTYPIADRSEEPIYLPSVVSGVRLQDNQGHFRYAKSVRLTFNLNDTGLQRWSRQWMLELRDYLIFTQPSPYWDFGLYQNDTLSHGLLQVSRSFMPKIVITVMLLALFATLCSLVFLIQDGYCGIDWTRTKPTLALIALANSGLAVVSAFGLVLLCGVDYNVITTVMPFLVVSIGVDDMFIMTAAWHRTNPKDPANVRLAYMLSDAAVSITITSVTDALSFAIGCYTLLPGVWVFCTYVAAGITFTYIYQLTFFTAFAALAGDLEEHGRHSLLAVKVKDWKKAESAADRWFLAGTIHEVENTEQVYPMADIVVSELTKGEDVSVELASVTNGKTQKVGAKKPIKFSTQASIAQHQVTEEAETRVSKFFRNYYGPILLHPAVKILVALWFVVYIGLATYGCFHVKEGLDPRFLIESTHFATRYYSMMEKTFWKFGGLQASVVVRHPPDFLDSNATDRMKQMVHAFEGTKFTMEGNSTMFWYRHFERWWKEEQDKAAEWEEDLKFHDLVDFGRQLKRFLRITQGKDYWSMDIVWNKTDAETDVLCFSDPPFWEEDFRNRNISTNNYTEYMSNILHCDDRFGVKAFRFSIGLKHLETMIYHRDMTLLMRSICDRPEFGEFDLISYHEYYPFSDQFIILIPTLIRNIGIAVIVMVVVSFLFIPSYMCAFMITAAIMSIVLGVIGYMPFFNVNIDSVSMITILMAIGFAVDLSAHISYAYVKAPGTAYDRAIHALETLGWPVFQGGFSTALGMTVLATVDAYVIHVFFVTVMLVIGFGMLHSLVFLPVALTVIIPASERLQRKVGSWICKQRMDKRTGVRETQNGMVSEHG